MILIIFWTFLNLDNRFFPALAYKVKSSNFTYANKTKYA